jgi:hypothetical protein
MFVTQAAWQLYDLHTNPDGTISGIARTNDDDDDGLPDQEISWTVFYRDREEMLQRTGGTHIGVSGVLVSVYLDDREVKL